MQGRSPFCQVDIQDVLCFANTKTTTAQSAVSKKRDTFLVFLLGSHPINVQDCGFGHHVFSFDLTPLNPFVAGFANKLN